MIHLDPTAVHTRLRPPDIGPAAPGPLADDLDDAPLGALAPDHPSLRAIVGALMCAGGGAEAAGWALRGDDAETIQRVGLEAVRVRLHADDAQAAWRDACAISPLALDVLTVVVDQLQIVDAGVVMVCCSDILDAKGCRRRGAELQALQQQIGKELMRLGRIQLGMADRPAFLVTPIDDADDCFVVTLDPELKARWRDARVCHLSWRLLQFDHRTNRGADVLAKKTGLYFGLAGAGSKPVVRSIRSVLMAVGALHELSAGHRGGRIADRFEEAVLRLEERKLFTISQRRREGSIVDSRIKGWINAWLETQLVVRPFG